MTVDRVPILMYHRVGLAKNDWERKYCVDARRFRVHMDALANAGWHALSIGDFFQWLAGSIELEGRPFLLTFDDGFQSVYEHAAPIVAAKGWPATVFVVSGLLGQTDEWCARQNPNGFTYPLMRQEHIHELRNQRFTFHSHTRSHADLPTLDDATLRMELAGSRAELKDAIGEPVDYLAYPYGHLDDRVVNAANAAGYRAAFSTQPGFNRRSVDLFRLRRLDVFGTDSAAALKRKIRLGSNDGSVGYTLKYALSRVAARLGSRQDAKDQGTG